MREQHEATVKAYQWLPRFLHIIFGEHFHLIQFSNCCYSNNSPFSTNKTSEARFETRLEPFGTPFGRKTSHEVQHSRPPFRPRFLFKEKTKSRKDAGNKTEWRAKGPQAEHHTHDAAAAKSKLSGEKTLQEICLGKRTVLEVM